MDLIYEHNRIAELRRQRDELCEALQGLVNGYEELYAKYNTGACANAEYAAARAALAKARGEA